MIGQPLLNNVQINDLNKISSFIAVRDIPYLSKEALLNKYQLESADVLILLGSSLIFPLEIAAKALREGVVQKLMLVGGIGHSTHYLYDNIHKSPQLSSIKTEGRAESDIYKDILIQNYHINESDILVENKSTNCGSNAKNALQCLKENNLKAHSFILIQDPTMQLRTYASFLHEWANEDALFINYAPYIPLLSLQDNEVIISNTPEKAWPINRLVSLLMGEIPRLQDNESGYGPKGKNFIIHVDIPDEVIRSYSNLLNELQDVLKNRS